MRRVGGRQKETVQLPAGTKVDAMIVSCFVCVQSCPSFPFLYLKTPFPTESGREALSRAIPPTLHDNTVCYFTTQPTIPRQS